MSSKKVQLPKFMKCSEIADDPYWKQVFKECALGRFPRGSYIDGKKGMIGITPKTSRRNAPVEWTSLLDSPDELIEQIKELFQTKLRMFSKRDREEKQEQIDDYHAKMQQQQNSEWKVIRRKKVGVSKIRQFVLAEKEIRGLDNKQSDELYRMLRLAFLFTSIDDSKVRYVDGQIEEIATLRYLGNGKYVIDEIPTAKYKEERVKSSKLSDQWTKTLDAPRNCYSL